MTCKSIGCNGTRKDGQDFCPECLIRSLAYDGAPINPLSRYHQGFRDVSDLSDIDVFAVHHLFDIQDPSGCIHYASRKILLMDGYQDIRKARDSLTRWLQLNNHAY